MSESKNKTVVITGGTQGIGLEIVKKFLVNDNNVFVGSRSESKEFKEQCIGATFVKTDVKKIADIENLMDIAVKPTGNIDVLINNAGIKNILYSSLYRVYSFTSISVLSNLSISE